MHYTLLILILTVGINAQSYPLFYLTPSNAPPHLRERVALVDMALDPEAPPLVTNQLSLRIDPSKSGEDKNEVGQFHTQDMEGKFIFGFNTPDQVRMEARDQKGHVRGSYSYIDAFGNLVKMQYWDDGNGFHAVGNNLPRAYFEPPQYTPEVLAARDEHFRLYKQAVALGNHKAHDEKDCVETSDSSDSNPENHKGLFGQEGEIIVAADSPEQSAEDDILDLENMNQDGVLSDFPQFPKVPYFSTTGVNPMEDGDPDEVDEESLDSVSLDNPELKLGDALLTRFWQLQNRKAKNFDMNKNPVSGELSNSASPRSEALLQEQGKEGKQFFYNFAHIVPVPVYLGEHQPSVPFQSSSVSAGAKASGSIPVAAVHDAQVSPSQRGNIPNYQILPLYLSA